MVLNRKIFLTFLVIFRGIFAFAGNDPQSSFIEQVVQQCRLVIKNIHEKNLGYIQANTFDLLQTDLSIDMSQWVYNEQDESWSVPSPTNTSNITLKGPHYYYKYDMITGETQSDTSHPATSSIGDFNKWQFQTQINSSPEKVILIYNVNVINLPLIKINRKYDGLILEDSSRSLYQSLKDLEFTSDGMWKDFAAMNNEVGQAIMDALGEFRIDQPNGVHFLLSYNSYSDPVKVGNKKYRFRFFNLFHEYNLNGHLLSSLNTVDEGLVNTLKYTVSLYEFRPNVHAEDILDALVETIRCENYGDCGGMVNIFTTPEAIAFWAEFNEKASVRGQEFFNQHKLTAIQIATSIDRFENRELAVELRNKGMCYIHNDFCIGNEMVVGERVSKATIITYKHLKFQSGLTLLNEPEIISAAQSNSTSVLFKVKQEGDEGEEAEFEFEFNTTQSRENMAEIMGQLGMSFRYNYQYYLFANNLTDTWSRYAYWTDMFYLKSPPAFVVILANIATGPVNAIYGFVTGTDMITGQELSGWDYVFNTFDIIGVGAVVGEIGSGFFKTIKVTKAGKVFVIAANTTGMYKAYHQAVKAYKTASSAVKNIIYKGMAWGINAAWEQVNNVLKLTDQLGNELARLCGKRLDINPNVVVVASNGQTFRIGDEIDIYINGEKQANKYEMVKDGQGNVGFRVVGANDVYHAGQQIAGKTIVQVKQGTNGKIAVVGRQMYNHVETVAENLKAQGKNVEILNDDYLNYSFNIDGQNWSVNSAWQDMKNNPAYDAYKDSNGFITAEYIELIPMFKVNKRWIEKIQSEGYTIIDVGYPPGLTTESVFYNMEISTIIWD